MNVYHSGHAPDGRHSNNPPTAMRAAHTHATGSVHGTRADATGPRTRAAASSTSAMLAAASETSHDSHRPRLTPPAGGWMPRPK